MHINRALADMDSDGRLGSEEFVLAMHLCDIAKAGETIPMTLPLELIPLTFRRQRQSSLTLAQNATENIDPLAGMPQVYSIKCNIKISFYAKKTEGKKTSFYRLHLKINVKRTLRKVKQNWNVGVKRY